VSSKTYSTFPFTVEIMSGTLARFRRERWMGSVASSFPRVAIICSISKSERTASVIAADLRVARPLG